MPGPWLDPPAVERVVTALHAADYTADGVIDRLGLAGSAALDRGDLAEAARALGPDDDPAATVIRLFLLGEQVPRGAARHAVPVDDLVVGGLLGVGDDDQIRAAMDLRPYAESGPARTGAAVTGTEPLTGPTWWVVSDLGTDLRPGRLAPDHVLGIGAAALTLAQATPRDRVDTALDIGTGCGVQSLHLSGHVGAVTATDLSERALRMAATTAALSGQRWELLAGDLLEPVRGRRFDRVVSNPPFVVGPGGPGHEYRDGRTGGDAVSRTLLRGVGDVLADDGTAHLLANWEVHAEQDWTERLGGWLAGTGCDAWIWQREIADPGEYVALWLRDAGLEPADPDYAAEHRRWRDWFDAHGVLGVGMGHVALRRTGRADPIVVCEDVPQALAQPVGALVLPWFRRAEWEAGLSDAALLACRLQQPADLIRTTHSRPGPDGWRAEVVVLRQAGGLRWEVEADTATAALVAGCTGGARLGDLIDLLAASTGTDPAALRTAALPVVRDLLRRDLLRAPTVPV